MSYCVHNANAKTCDLCAANEPRRGEACPHGSVYGLCSLCGIFDRILLARRTATAKAMLLDNPTS